MTNRQQILLVKFFRTLKKLVRSQAKTEERYAVEMAKIVEEFLDESE